MAIEHPIERKPKPDRHDDVLHQGVCAMIGSWVFFSALFLPYVEPSRTNTWLTGVLIGAVGLVGLVVSKARYVNAMLGAWLFISAFALNSTNLATVLNSAISGLAVFVVSLLPVVRDVPIQRRVKVRV